MWHKPSMIFMTTEMHSARCLYVRMEKIKRTDKIFCKKIAQTLFVLREEFSRRKKAYCNPCWYT
jgi:inorganic pyrophosphatase/exopolyphosphatase